MLPPIKSLIQSGTKLWLDSIDPDLIAENRARGATGATSNPIIVADLLKTGRFDQQIESLLAEDLDDPQIAWQMTDRLVQDAQDVFLPVWRETRGNDGYVSFELDPLLEDPEAELPHTTRVERYIELGKRWSAGHRNRMIKVPATPAGIEALPSLAAAGVPLNVTLIFTTGQYAAARDAVWAGAQRRSDGLAQFKSVYSIFVSRLDVYTAQHVPQLSRDAQGQVGILNAKRIWRQNVEFWQALDLPLQQEIIFASTGTKNPDDKPWKYVAAFAGSDIQTNPPATNEAVARSDVQLQRQIDQLPPPAVIEEIDRQVDFDALERTLMAEGIAKFAEPQKALIATIAEKRKVMSRS